MTTKIILRITNRSENTQRFLIESGISPALIDDIETFDIEVDVVTPAGLTNDTESRDPVLNTLVHDIEEENS